MNQVVLFDDRGNDSFYLKCRNPFVNQVVLFKAGCQEEKTMKRTQGRNPFVNQVVLFMRSMREGDCTRRLVSQSLRESGRFVQLIKLTEIEIEVLSQSLRESGRFVQEASWKRTLTDSLTVAIPS